MLYCRSVCISCILQVIGKTHGSSYDKNMILYFKDSKQLLLLLWCVNYLWYEQFMREDLQHNLGLVPIGLWLVPIGLWLVPIGLWLVPIGGRISLKVDEQKLFSAFVFFFLTPRLFPSNSSLPHSLHCFLFPPFSSPLFLFQPLNPARGL